MPRERVDRPRQQQPRDQLVEAGHHNGEAVALVADGAAHVLTHSRARRRRQSPPLRRRAAAPEGRWDRGARCRHSRREVRQQGSWTEPGSTATAADLAPSRAVHKLVCNDRNSMRRGKGQPSWIAKSIGIRFQIKDGMQGLAWQKLKFRKWRSRSAVLRSCASAGAGGCCWRRYKAAPYRQRLRPAGHNWGLLQHDVGLQHKCETISSQTTQACLRPQ